ARVLAASRSLGNALDTITAERAARRVNEALEKMLFTDVTYGFGEKDDRNRNSIYSYVNHPDRNQVAFTANHWDHAATTAANILADVLLMKTSAIAGLHYGPWQMYIPTNYDVKLDNDYDSLQTGTTDTIRSRILKIAGISGIKVVDTLTADNVLLVQMTSDVVRLVRGMGLTNVEWDTEGKFITKYKVLCIQVPQIRSDQNGKSGIVHMA
ncbi:MAG TPA: major capsid protein, partial [Candidatus Glassbacteria bacterium]|nr:major capsid protein [Candidatus Glassbacteria bacterium]